MKKLMLGFIIIMSLSLQGCLATNSSFLTGLAQGLSNNSYSNYHQKQLDYQRRQTEALEKQLRHQKYGY